MSKSLTDSVIKQRERRKKEKRKKEGVRYLKGKQ